MRQFLVVNYQDDAGGLSLKMPAMTKNRKFFK